MRRGELYITVPSAFRCPISLDVMRSPVSLCTGVTYDRSSIQNWLDAGHDTCPATMQVLVTKDFVPNLTLHRLINLWTQSSTRPPKPDRSPVDQVRVLIDKIESQSESSVDSLVKVVEFASSCEENKRFLASFDGFVEVIVGVLSKDCVEIRVMELVIRLLNLVLLENGVKEKLHKLVFKTNPNSLSSFVSVLRNGNSNSRIETVTVLESISLDNESKRLVVETHSLGQLLLSLVKTENDLTLNDGIFTLMISVFVTRLARLQLVQLGLVQALSNTLSNQNAAVSLVEKSLKLLSIVSTCPDGRAAICEDPICAGAIVERLMKVSKTATEDAVLVLWSMCCLFKDGRVREQVVRSNGVTKVLLVMQSEEGEGSVRRMCGELVKVLSVGCKNGGSFSGLASYETKTTHIMPC